CEIVIYGGGADQPTCTCFLRSARWMKRYSNFWRSVKQSGGVTSAVKHDADASQISTSCRLRCHRLLRWSEARRPPSGTALRCLKIDPACLNDAPRTQPLGRHAIVVYQR